MLKKICRATVIAILVCTTAFIFGCGEEPEMVTDVSIEEIVKELQTEADYRTALAELGTNEEDLQVALEYYDKLWLLDAFTEEDFVALATIYETLGDAEHLRDTLIRKHVYYPAEENLEEISNVIVYKNADDESVKALMELVFPALEEGNAEALNMLIISDDWKAEMQDDLVGVSRKTMYKGTGFYAQIISDEYSTELCVLKEDTTFYYYKLNAAGGIWAKTFWTEGSYKGEYTSCYYMPEGELLKACSGTFEKGVTVGEFTIEYDGRTYVGEFDENGKTTVEQKDKVTDNGGVIYAYNKSIYKYLYEENTTQEKFVVDYEYLGLPMYVEWE